MLDRRTVAALVVLASIVAPAVVLRLACSGRACEEPAEASTGVPFCSLPDGLRRALVDGFQEGRSPDVIGVTHDLAVVGTLRNGSDPAPWPALAGWDENVPLILGGAGIDQRADFVDAGLDDVAPTLAEAIGLVREHPEVRSGRALPVLDGEGAARLAVVVVLKGLRSEELRNDPRRWSTLVGLADAGASTMTARAGSLPLDPAAIATTVGTGGLPRQHGITGTWVRNDSGKLVEAWGRGSPVSVIATLGDDLDEANDQKPSVGVVGTATYDRGLIGGNWYIDVDRDEVSIEADRSPRTIAAVAERMLSRFDRDEVPDLLTVALDATDPGADRAVARIIEMAERSAPGSTTYAIAGTGTSVQARELITVGRLVREVERRIPGRAPVVEGAVPGGFYVDQRALAQRKIPEDRVIQAVDEIAGTGAPLFFDSFAAITVTFARYC